MTCPSYLTTLNAHNTIIPFTPLESGPWLKTTLAHELNT